MDTIPAFHNEKINHERLLHLSVEDNPVLDKIFPSKERQKEFVEKLVIYQGLQLNKIEVQFLEEMEDDHFKESENLKRPITLEIENIHSKKSRVNPSEKSVDERSNIFEISDPLEICGELFLTNFHSLDLVSLLKKTVTGHGLLNKYQNEILPGSVRKALVDLIIRSLMEIPISASQNKIEAPELKNHHFEILTKKFCCIFKKESPETYFIPPKTTGKNQTIARGKFVDKYRNWRTAQKE